MTRPRRPDADGDGSDREAGEAALLEAAALFSLRPSLAVLAEGARRLTGARFGAVGLPGPEPEEFSAFVTAGLTDAQIDAIGPLPRLHGLLGAVMSEAAPLRTPDLRADPRSRGWWPRAHPPMSALLGAPLLVGESVVGAVYVANDAGKRPFDAADEWALVRMAGRAAPLVRALRQAEDGRVLAVAAERARMARDLHDALSQSLFSIGLRAEAAARDLDRAPERASAHLASIAELARTARRELGVVVEGLRPPSVDEEGLDAALGSLAATLDRLGPAEVSVRATGEPEPSPERDREAFLILQEALVNAVRHGRARRVELELRHEAGALAAEVRDDGVGFDPATPPARSGRMGLSAMRERAAALDAHLEVRSRPGEGVTVTLRVPGA